MPARLLGSTGALLVCLCGLGCGVGSDEVESAAETAEPPRMQAEVLTVQPRSWPFVVRTQGNVIADESAVIGTRVAGRVAEVHVDLGDRVRAGDPLVALDRAEFELQVRQADAARAQARAAIGLSEGDPVSELDPLQSPPVREQKALWDEARSSHDRGRQLSNRGAITTAELQQLAAAERVAEARYNSAVNAVHEKIALISVREAELGLARQRLEDTLVEAPFDGQVEERHVAPGTYVDVGHEIVTIVRTNPLRFRGTIPERHARRLAIGQEVQLHVESLDEPYPAKVTRISPAVDVLSRGLMFEAKVENAEGRIRAGLFSEADVVLDPHARTVVVPTSAVTEFAGAEKVWKVVDGLSEEVVVLTGQRRGDAVEVLEGIAPGDTILVEGAAGRVARIDPVAVTEAVAERERPNVPQGGDAE